MKESNYTVEPLSNRCFMSHATDGVYDFGFINDETLRSLFTLNCLFFDNIAVGASDLLGNPVLYQMLNNDKESMTLLYRSRDSGGEGIIQPVLMGEHESMSSVAETMIKGSTIHSLDEQSMENHAKLIDDLSPEFLYCKEYDFRSCYYENILNAIKRVNSDGMIDWLHSKQIFPMGGLTKLVNWLTNYASKDNLRCSSVFSFADENLIEELRFSVKVMAESIYQYTLSQMQIATLSVPEPYVPMIDLARFNTSSGKLIREFHNEDLVVEEVKVILPLKFILDLPMEDVIIVRKLDSFRKIRNLMADFRFGYRNVSVEEVQRAIDYCSQQFLEYVNKTPLQRSIFIKDLARDRWKTEAGILLTQISIPIGINLLFAISPSHELPTTLILSCLLTAAAIYFQRRYLPSRITAPSVYYSGSLGEKVTYHPVMGNLTAKDSENNRIRM